jgi:hypothetical protein
MSGERRPAHKRPRRYFDRSIALARFRWEILRRTAEYQADICNIIRSIAATIGCSEARLKQDCLEGGGIILPVFGDGSSSREHYDKICARYGLTALIHPEVSFSIKEMAAFPIFGDTPERQPVVKDRAVLRRVARHGGDISPRTLRRIFEKKRVEAGPFRLKLKRIHLGRLDTILAVFDARTIRRESFRRIAEDLRLSLDQAKRAWQTARRLISKWFDFEGHLSSCEECQQYAKGRRDRMCVKAEQQIGLRTTGGSRLRLTHPDALDLLHARLRHELPARRSLTDPDAHRAKRLRDV